MLLYNNILLKVQTKTQRRIHSPAEPHHRGQEQVLTAKSFANISVVEKMFLKGKIDFHSISEINKINSCTGGSRVGLEANDHLVICVHRFAYLMRIPTYK